MNNTKLLTFLKKTIALGLIFSSLVQTYLSINSILFIYPRHALIINSNQIYLNLIKKAIYLSSSLFADSFYGFILFIKPMARTKHIHLVFGILLLIFSFLFFRIHAFDNLIKNWLFFPIN